MLMQASRAKSASFRTAALRTLERIDAAAVHMSMAAVAAQAAALGGPVAALGAWMGQGQEQHGGMATAAAPSGVPLASVKAAAAAGDGAQRVPALSARAASPTPSAAVLAAGHGRGSTGPGAGVQGRASSSLGSAADGSVPCRVRVVTRHAAGPRGVAVGTLVAYDRWMNVVLRDVEETYSVRVRVTRTKLRPKPPPFTLEKADAAHMNEGQQGQPYPALVQGVRDSAAGVEDAAAVAHGQAAALGAARREVWPAGHSSAEAPVQGAGPAARASEGSGDAAVCHKSQATMGKEAADASTGPEGLEAVLKHAWKQEQRVRQLGQVFIKADCIVLISRVSD